jgi:hypothetical protein
VRLLLLELTLAHASVFVNVVRHGRRRSLLARGSIL